MRTRRITKSKYKNLKGIVVPQAHLSNEDLALLTTDGKTIPIVKNEKYNFLKNLIWESVSAFGRLVNDPITKKEFLEVIFFASATPMSYESLDLLDMDKIDESMTCA